MSSRSQARAFAQYNRRLIDLASSSLGGGSGFDPDLLAPSLDGESAEQLRQLVPLTYRRQVGAFFTSGAHREAVAAALTGLPPGPYLDPTCGAGDLLLAASRLLPAGSDLASTLDLWAPKLSGWDIHPEFVEAAKLRLVLAAAGRSCCPTSDEPVHANLHRLQTIQKADATTKLKPGNLEGTVILMNPPFGSMTAPNGCRWAEGLTSRAAIFVESALDSVRSGCHIVALLPDVLRTGSNFEHWREMVELRCRILSVKPLGLFDKHTDIDVFLLVVQPFDKAKDDVQRPFKSKVSWWDSQDFPNRETIGDHFSVMVGPVVDNRDPHQGSAHPFIIARDLPRRGIVDLPVRMRRFSGRLFSPPFVLLRRTSRPTSDGSVRAPGVLMKGDRLAAIDNHLLVATPHDGQISTCLRLLSILEQPQTTRFLDQRMRCRHLTVRAVRELSWDLAQADS